jgi:hypothetical protein
VGGARQPQAMYWLAWMWSIGMPRLTLSGSDFLIHRTRGSRLKASTPVVKFDCFAVEAEEYNIEDVRCHVGPLPGSVVF